MPKNVLVSHAQLCLDHSDCKILEALIIQEKSKLFSCQIFNASYFNSDVVPNYCSKISHELALYWIAIVNYKRYFHYSYETNPEKRLVKIHGELKTFLFPMSECFGDVVNEPCLV